MNTYLKSRKSTMMKRSTPLLLAVALLGAMATGCSTSEASAGTAEAVAESPQAEA